MKTCSKCTEDKHASDFHRGRVCNDCQREYRRQYHAKNRDRRNAYCRKYHENRKEQMNARHRQWRKDNKEHVKAKDQERYDCMRAFIDEAKAKPCTDCGQHFPPCAMDFDHVRGTKKFQISASLKRYTVERVQEEMNKCELVCANCHRIRTHLGRNIKPR